jgi:hypothetical protein
MANESAHDSLLKILQRTATHFGIADAETVSFRKREKLLLQLKMQNEDAFDVMTEVIHAQLTLDRILKDEEKKKSNPEFWNAEFEKAKHEREEAQAIVEGFFEENKISLEGIR